jgi:hypothetical protein
MCTVSETILTLETALYQSHVQGQYENGAIQNRASAVLLLTIFSKINKS